MNRIVEGRLLELLADRVTEGLCPTEAAELRRLRPEGCSEYLEFERAAAAIDLALALPVAEPLPRALRDRILIGAGRYMESVDRRVAAGREAFK
jgi:hypothetical protein